MSATDDDIREALTALERLILERVRAEQRRDQLTSLPNGAALNAGINERLLAKGSVAPFWIAFVEVDRFKSINDKFGYEHADALLRKIASALEMCRTWFGEASAVAFRAHGDEFYLMGSVPTGGAELVAEGLDGVRDAVARIALMVEKRADLMKCTVSVGWLLNDDVGELQTDRTIMAALETAAGEAKRTRNAVVRYSRALQKDDSINLRADCSACETKFSLDVRRSSNKEDETLFCPNCGAHVTRGPTPSLAPAAKPVTSI